MTRRTSSPPNSRGKVSADGALDVGPVWVGIDASLTNWAAVVVDKDGGFLSYLVQPKTKGGDRLDFLYESTQGLFDLLARASVTVEGIVMEGYAFGVRGSRSHSIGEGGGVTKLAVIHAGYGSIAHTFTPTGLKKFVCSKGNAKKNEVMLGVYKHWNVEFADDNLADAYALAKVAYHNDNAPDLKYQAEALSKGLEAF